MKLFAVIRDRNVTVKCATGYNYAYSPKLIKVRQIWLEYFQIMMVIVKLMTALL